MFDPFTLSLIGGAAGGLLSKRDPLKGALMGAGLGYAGGAMAPAIGGLFGTSPASTVAADGMADATYGATGYNTGLGQQQGLLDTIKGGIKTAGEYAKPIGESAMAAQAVGGMFATPQQAPVQPGPIMQNTGGAQTLASIAQSNAQGLGALQDADMQRKLKQKQMIAQMMGRSYG